MMEDSGRVTGSRASTEPSVPLSRPDGFDPARLDRAIEFAARAHRYQVDKAGEPYILHPLRVMLRLGSEPLRVAAVLHDVVEDTASELDEIRDLFGDEICEAVDALTRREGETYSDFIERCGANSIARSVKWADLCDNMDLRRLRNVTANDRARYAKYEAARERLNAIAMEARQGRDGATRLDPKDDSAGPKDIAQKEGDNGQ